MRTLAPLILGLSLLVLAGIPAAAEVRYPAQPAVATQDGTYSNRDLIVAGHAFFGEASQGLSQALETLFARYGRPNGYILGEEGSAAFFGGLRYGEGVLHTARMGSSPVFWQGPSFGWDVGGSGTRVMMLVYDLPSVEHLMQRYAGVDGSAYLVGGLSLQVMTSGDTVVVPVRTGVGARLGVSVGYLKFTRQPTWNPF